MLVWSLRNRNEALFFKRSSLDTLAICKAMALFTPLVTFLCFWFAIGGAFRAQLPQSQSLDGIVFLFSWEIFFFILL
jgi:hypothetical protein